MIAPDKNLLYRQQPPKLASEPVAARGVRPRVLDSDVVRIPARVRRSVKRALVSGGVHGFDMRRYVLKPYDRRAFDWIMTNAV